MLDEAELDEDEYDPFAAFKPAEPQEQPVYHRAPLFSAPSTIRPTEQSQTKPSEAPLFLPFVLEDDQTQELIKEMHLTPAQVSQLEARSWTTGTGRRFTQLGSR